MSLSISEIVAGRKVFFIAPDTSLFPENFLEEYFSMGYECYFVENDKTIALETKLDILIQIFHDVIFFFNVDANIPGISWPVLIKKILDKYNNHASIGVVYAKRQSREDKSNLEKKYLYELGLQCGCIQLEYRKKENFGIIEKILYANQATGRRKNVRALCSNSCTFSFVKDGANFSGSLQDISLSHVSFVFPDENMPVQLYEKIEGIRFNIRGFIFSSDAVLIMKREVEDGILFVFAFLDSSGGSGLEPRIRELLVPSVYQIMAFNCKSLLDEIYSRFKNKKHKIVEQQ